MTPREAKPSAKPFQMPRTEDDLDKLMKAIEGHKSAGHRIGHLINRGSITAKQALDLAAEADEKLYNHLDTLQMEREEVVEAERSAAGSD
jgi:hypothetical protein